MICSDAEVKDSYSAEKVGKFDKTLCFVSERWMIELKTVFEFMYDQSSFVQENLNQLKSTDQYFIAQSVEQFIVQMINDILDIQAERNNNNLPAENISPVFSHQLVQLHDREFNDIVAAHRSRLAFFWDDIIIDTVEQQFKKLRLAYLSKLGLKSALNKCNVKTGFETDWIIVKGRKLNVLKNFCGCIATVFPNTASVESDFSQLAWEKDEHRMNITDLSLEGVLQCKQFELLSSLI